MVAGIKLPKWIGNGWKMFKRKKKEKQQPKQTNKNKVNKQKNAPKAHHLNTNNNPPELEML